MVTVNIIRAEMGQHVGTALARILADELEADWDKVRIIHVDSDPKWGLMVTGGSWSVWQTFPIFSRAGAAGRIALIEEAAKLLGVPPAGVPRAQRRGPSPETGLVSYGEIVRRGELTRPYTPEELDRLPIKPAGDAQADRPAGQALDIPAKTDGKALYGIDAKVRGHGLRAAEGAADPLRLGGGVDRRQRRAAGQGLSAQHRARRSVGHGARLGDGASPRATRPRSAPPMSSRSTGRPAKAPTSRNRRCRTTPRA